MTLSQHKSVTLTTRTINRLCPSDCFCLVDYLGRLYSDVVFICLCAFSPLSGHGRHQRTSADLQAGRDPGPIPGRRPAAAEVVRDPTRPPRRLLFHHGPVPGRRRVPGFVPGHYRQVDPVRDPAVLNRPRAGPTKHPVPPSRRVRPGVAVRDPRKDRLGRPAGSRRPPPGIRVLLDIPGCPAVPDRRAPSSHHHQPASCAIRPDRLALAMDQTTGGRWRFACGICRCARRTRA